MSTQSVSQSASQSVSQSVGLVGQLVNQSVSQSIVIIHNFMQVIVRDTTDTVILNVAQLLNTPVCKANFSIPSESTGHFQRLSSGGSFTLSGYMKGRYEYISNITTCK